MVLNLSSHAFVGGVVGGDADKLELRDDIPSLFLWECPVMQEGGVVDRTDEHEEVMLAVLSFSTWFVVYMVFGKNSGGDDDDNDGFFLDFFILFVCLVVI